MANTLPSFVNSANKTAAVSPALTITSNQPASLVKGNLLIAVFYEGNAVSGNTYTVNAPWTICLDVVDGSGLAHFVVAFTYVKGDGNDVACTFTTTGTSGNSLFVTTFQYKDARISAPIGNVAGHSSHTTAVPSCGSITASAGNSLAVAILFAANIGDTWPPAGWTSDQAAALSNSFYAAHLTLANSGDTTGALSSSSDGYWGFANIEILGALPMVADKYFNGLPFPGAQTNAIQPSNWGKFFFNGLVQPALYKVGFIAPPPPGNKGGGGTGKGGGGKGGGGNPGPVHFDPYGTASHYAYDEEAWQPKKRRFGIYSSATAFSHTVTVASAGAVAFLKAVSKTIAPSSTGAVSVLKRAAKTLAIAASTSTATTAFRAFLQTITATGSSAVSLAKSVGKIRAIPGRSNIDTLLKLVVMHSLAVSSSVAVAKTLQVGKGIATTGTSATAFGAKTIGKGIAIALAGGTAWTLAAAHRVAVAGSTSTAVAASRLFLRTVTVACAGTVASTRQAAIAIAAAGSSAVAQTLAVATSISVAASGAVAVVKSIGKTIADAAAGAAIIITTRHFGNSPAPLARTIAWLFESRSIAFPAESRIISATAESRAIGIAAESRSLTIPAASRTINLEDESREL